ncbi:hypothetical protein Sjap_020130 [Stephania japonica]|uniref:Uncharacterized protein n=1 Tax=Stephania japonica TaxID=461633 RepID=A0AAP0F049_9MAGN
MSAIPLESVKVNEVTLVEGYWSELEETLVVSLHEPYIEIARNEEDEAEKEIEVISKRLEESQKESKENQPLVLVKPLPPMHTYDHDATESYVLEVPNELLNLKGGMPTELPKAIDVSFVVDISIGHHVIIYDKSS